MSRRCSFGVVLALALVASLTSGCFLVGSYTVDNQSNFAVLTQESIADCNRLPPNRWTVVGPRSTEKIPAFGAGSRCVFIADPQSRIISREKYVDGLTFTIHPDLSHDVFRPEHHSPLTKGVLISIAAVGIIGLLVGGALIAMFVLRKDGPPARPYPLNFDVDNPDSRQRLTVAFRFILALPHTLLVGSPGGFVGFSFISFIYAPLRYVTIILSGNVLGAVAGVMSMISWFAIVFTGRQPRGLWGFSAMYLHWRANALAYTVLLRDEYPPFGEGAYPVRFSAGEFPGRRNRLSVGFRFLLVLPQSFALFFVGIFWSLSVMLAWLAIMLAGRYPDGLYRFSVAYWRWSLRVSSYSLLMHDQYPPFTLSDDHVVGEGLDYLTTTYPVLESTAPARSERPLPPPMKRKTVLLACSLALAYVVADIGWYVIVKHDVFSVVFDITSILVLGTSIRFITQGTQAATISKGWFKVWGWIALAVTGFYLLAVVATIAGGEWSDFTSSLALSLTYGFTGWAFLHYRPIPSPEPEQPVAAVDTPAS